MARREKDNARGSAVPEHMATMREQFYGDSRDVSKWSVIAQLATCHQVRDVLQVAMLRPDRHDTQGSTRHDPLYCHPAVKAFFDRERRIGVRDLRKVTSLPEYCNFRFRVEVVAEGFWGEGFGPYRAAYFRGVLGRHNHRTIPASRVRGSQGTECRSRTPDWRGCAPGLSAQA